MSPFASWISVLVVVVALVSLSASAAADPTDSAPNTDSCGVSLDGQDVLQTVVGLAGRVPIYIHVFVVLATLIRTGKASFFGLLLAWIVAMSICGYTLVVYLQGRITPATFASVSYVTLLGLSVAPGFFGCQRVQWQRIVGGIALALTAVFIFVLNGVLIFRVYPEVVRNECMLYFFFLAKAQMSDTWRKVLMALFLISVITIALSTCLAGCIVGGGYLEVDNGEDIEMPTPKPDDTAEDHRDEDDEIPANVKNCILTCFGIYAASCVVASLILGTELTIKWNGLEGGPITFLDILSIVGSGIGALATVFGLSEGE
ncbi:hypothetical protein M427DRAFT_44295 [Gonapodya prolifera JEL478]|uniref:DUF4203 domain-containing protein n=1 Tax=Gonapodya prolifera (strain JEL478) TaxID=1344416 RepID=A0A139AG02_GONPJ|nr:hypothetical protein M427DRAFT_44295 [Gonapodya prolifera JEL478]|eukprot:KXS15690.1 hypothetical protein M427DRAFT_44295 [Gonapodya prolifera JEL478]